MTMPAESMIQCETRAKRFGHFSAVDHVSFSVAIGFISSFLKTIAPNKRAIVQIASSDERLNEPPEPSPGLSGAMPWDNVPQIISRPEGAREASGRSERVILNSRRPKDEQFSRPFRAASLLSLHPQGIAHPRSALGIILMAFQAITGANFLVVS